MVSLSAFGQDGPQKGYVGYGPSLDAWAGLDHMTAYENGRPNALGGMFPDTSSAIHAAAAILAALQDRDRNGRGCYIDLSELEVSILLLGDLAAECFNGNQPSAARQFGSDINFRPGVIAASARTNGWPSPSRTLRAWEGLCKTLGRRDWTSDPTSGFSRGPPDRVPARSRTALPNGFAGKSAGGDDRAPTNGVPAAVANTAQTLLSDPHLVERQFLSHAVEHPEVGSQLMYGPIWRFAGQSNQIHRAAPLLGADNDYVLGTLLGISKQRSRNSLLRK